MMDSNYSGPMEDLAGSVREYVDIKIDDIKLRSVKGLSVSVSRILSLMLIVGVALVLVLVLSFGLILLLGEAVGGYAAAAFIVAGLLAAMLAAFIIFRNRMFRDSFVRLFVKLFFGGEND